MKFFSDIPMKYLNPQVKINKMINEHTVNYHSSPSELTLRIHPLIFLWTPKGFIFSPKCFLNFFSNLYFAPCQWKTFKLMVLRLLENAFVSQKVEPVHFHLNALSKNPPQVLITTTYHYHYHSRPGRRKLTISPKKRFLQFSSTEREEDYGAEKMTKIKLATVLVTSFT